MGPTGAGKSTFIDRAVGLPDINVGHQLTSCTKDVRAVRHWDGVRNIVLVDTPGFCHDTLSNTQVLREIMDWMKSTHDHTKFDGLLYLHRISDNRWWIGTPFNQLGDLCGREFEKIVFVTTMWDEVPEVVGIQREEELRNTFWNRMIKLGSTAHRFTGSKESGWEIIRTISERIPMHKTSTKEGVLDSYTGPSLIPKRSIRRVDRHSSGRNGQTPPVPKRHTLQTIPSSASVPTSDITTDGSVWTASTSISHFGLCCERGYKGALAGAITALKLARSVAEIFQIICLTEAIVASLGIALSIEVSPSPRTSEHPDIVMQAMAGTHHALFQVVENATVLIGVISDHAQKSHLKPEMTMAVGMFAKELGRVHGIATSTERKNPLARM
ncbi:hypothetical protein J3A83DRAFT_2529642 [Scleroderma citrinum]